MYNSHRSPRPLVAGPFAMAVLLLAGFSQAASAQPAAKLAFVRQPTSVRARTTIAPGVTVAVEDAGGNVVTTDSSNLTVVIVSPATGGGTLCGTLTERAVNGVATFSNLSISTAGIYTLQAVDGTLTPATSVSFTMTAPAASAYTLKMLAAFEAGNGAEPNDSVIMDGSGNLYGTLPYGGGSWSVSGYLTSGSGSVFVVTAAAIAAGDPAYSTLAEFNGTNGATPVAGLIMDGSGNLYGTTSEGGANGYGTVFEITAASIAAGSPAITMLASFNGTNGQYPEGGLIMDGSGNLYGTTYKGANGYGTMFEITAASIAAGSPAITTLAEFNGTNGAGGPMAGLIMDGSGNFYGTTSPGSGGTVFELRAGTNTITVLASFNGTNGQDPEGGLIMDGGGNLYGTTSKGGANGEGTVFKITAASIASGNPAITTLAEFNGTNGANPSSGLIMDGSGNLYGTTVSGGTNGYGDGTVFELSPVPAGQAAKLAFVQPPTNVQTGSAIITPAVTVAVEDSNGNIVTTDRSNVTLAIGPGSGSGTLGGTLTVTAVNGVATFSNLSISEAGAYTLQATDADNGTVLTPATSGSFTIPAQLGSLQITLLPAAAVTAGAKWSVDGGTTWQISGATVSGISEGLYTVNYQAVANWTAPASESVAISNGVTLSLTRTYAAQPGQYGSVQVTLGPAGAITAGAEWNVDGAAWQASGATVSDLTVGTDNHTINYKPVTDWNYPASASVTITANTTTNVTGTYTPYPGGVTVRLAPAAAVTAGAQWNVDGGAWQNSGATVSDLVAGNHSLAYRPISSWSQPPTETVSVVGNQVVSFTRTYTSDTTPPAVSCEYPAPGDTYVDPLASIKLRVTDAGSGVNLSTVQITASRDGGTTTETLCNASNLTPAAPASSAASAVPYFGCFDATANGNKVFKGKTYIGGASAADYVLVFQPDTDAAFGYDETVTVSVTASDWAGNTMAPSSTSNPPSLYSFTVEPRNFGCNLQVDGGTAGDAFPATATDAAGNIWVAWERDTDAVTNEGTLWLAERKDATDAWNFGPEIPVTSFAQNGDCHKPAIAVTAGGTIYAAYEVHSLPTPSIGVASATTAAPAAWTQVGPVTGASFTLQTAPAITCVNSTNTLYVAGVGADAGGVQQIGVATLSGGASNWTVTPVTSGGSDKSSPAIAQDANGIVYVVWTNTADNNLYGADSASGWTTIHQAMNTGTAGSPAIATESTGNVLHFAWVATGGTNPDIQYANTYPAGGWPATPLTAGTSVLNQTGLQPTGILDANLPKIAVTGTTSASANAQVFILWQGRLSNVPGATDIYFTERMWNGQFYPMPVQVSVVPAGLGLAAESAHSPTIGQRLDGTPYAAWTDLREAGASHVFFAQAMGAPCLPPPPPILVNPTGTAGGPPAQFMFGSNPHFTEVDIAIPNDAFGTSINMLVNELSNPVVACLGGAGLFADGSGLYLDITGGSGCGGGDSDADVLGDWITVTIHLMPGVTFPSPLAVYRLAPPTVSSLGAYTWTADLIRNVSYNAATGVLTFHTMHLSSFGVGAAAPAAASSSGSGGGGGGGGGCAMSSGSGAEADVFVLLLPPAALAIWIGIRLIRRERSAKV